MSDIKTTGRAPVPPAEPVCPNCPICGKELEPLDDFECSDCEASWPFESFHLGGTWHEPEAAQCPSAYKPYPDDHREILAKLEYRCVLSKGHDGKHGNGEGDDWPGVEAGA